jgi:hypothetical protein
MKNWDEIIQKCPRLYKNGMIFECGRGWFDIVRDLSIKIEGILEKNAERYQISEGEEDCEIQMFAVQVKQKYGTLRFYMCCETKEIEELIREAEVMSSHTCEECGDSGNLRGAYWFEVICDKCFKERK